MRIGREEYSKELDRLLFRSEVPAPGAANEYYAARGKDGRLLAAGVCWKSRLHPGRMRFFVSVEELYQGGGVATAVFHQMREAHPGAKWQGSAELDNESAEFWLRGMGFEFSYRCYWLDAMLPDFQPQERYALPIRRYSELTDAQRLHLLAMIETDYAAKWRQIDPVNEALDAATLAAWVIGEIDEQTSCCLMDGEEIAAYALCGPGDGDWSAGVRQTGHRLGNEAKYREFLIEFAHRAFEQAGSLILEAESFDGDMLALMRLFGELPDDSYDTYALG